jgi:expansin (peptidoglycan-binding protein)
MHATPRSRFRAPWTIAALAALGVIALAVGAVRFVPSSCAATAPLSPAPASPSVASLSVAAPASGEAVYYNPEQAEDRCSIEPLAPGGLYASVPAAEYDGGAVCGAYLDISGPLGTIQAEIIDMCPGCGRNQLDLGTAAFTRIQRLSRGTALISYGLARDPALPGPLAVRVGAGSSAGTLALQVLNHGNPLAGVRVDGQALTRRSDGYWVAPHGAGLGPFEVRVTDVLGNSTVLAGITLRPGAVQRTAVLMYSPDVSSGSPRPVPAPAPPPSAGASAPRATASSRQC